MFRIFLCDDDPCWLKRLEALVTGYLALKDYNIERALSVSNPTALLGYLKDQPQKNGLYILDVDLKHEINGIALAAEIRRMDTHGKIIFVTTYEELAYLTFRHRVEALDYIIKDRPEEMARKIQECIELAYRHDRDDTLEKPHFQVQTGDAVRSIPLDEIMFFEAHPSLSKKLILHTDNGRIEFYGSLSEAAEIGPEFYRSHKSYVVNTKNIRRVDKAERIIEMTSGEIALVAARKVIGLLETMTEQQKSHR